LCLSYVKSISKIELNILFSMTKLLNFSFLTILITVVAACGTTKNQPQKPMESYVPPAEIPPSLSTVNIPIRLNAAEIERLLNNKLSGAIYEDNNLEDDGLMMKATKTQNINIKLDGFTMSYRVPLKLWVFKKVLGSKGIEAEGELALNFKTNVNVQPEWWMWTKTELVGQEWLRNMAVKTGIGNVDVKYIADIIIGRSKTLLTEALDKQITQSFQIRPSVEEAWNTMQKPVSIASQYGTWWVKMTPQSIEMTPFTTSGDILKSNISVQSFAEVVAGSNGQTPVFRPNTTLPQFKVGYSESDAFGVNLTTDISFAEAEQIAKNLVVGQVFNPGGKTIRVDNLQIFGQNNKMVVNTKFTGDYTGSLYLIGTPKFDAQKNTIYLDDVDYDLSTKDFLLKSATWLFDKTILKKMKESCVFPLDDNVKAFKSIMNDQLRDYRMNANVSIKGAVEDIKVTDIQLLQDKIKIWVTSKGKLNLDVEGLDKF
jgi:hypothetical protein